jgi:L-aspartate oxidase
VTGEAGVTRRLPGWRLPGWRRDADVVVVGSGAAGIAVALAAAARGLRVLVVTKDLVGGATPMAQGGLAAALGAGDTPAAHVADTLIAGAGLCAPDVVAALAAAAPGAIGWLAGLGAQLETRDLRLEGGHSARRIVHSGDDATGAEVHRALLAELLASGIEVLDRTVALDLIPGSPDPGSPVPGGAVLGGADPGGAAEMDGAEADAASRAAAANADPAWGPASARPVAGLAAALIGADGRLSPGEIAAPAVVIAAGGLGQAFGTTSNPAGATGDGIAIAARAGAVLRDLEFVQFHPTVLWLPDASGQCPLVTEALRGAGAVLRCLDGTPLMAGHDPRGDLAPRDVVAARMAQVIAAGAVSGAPAHVWLDATALGREELEDGFPTVTAACRKHGIDPVREMIPVAPGAHYSCGGIRADLDGRTSVPGLYAAGEAASTGVQGANRLASNSVTEAVIAGRRTGSAIAGALTAAPANLAGGSAGDARRSASGSGAADPLAGPVAHLAAGEAAGTQSAGAAAEQHAAQRRELAQAMSRFAGVMRDADGLGRLLAILGGTRGLPRALPPSGSTAPSTAMAAAEPGYGPGAGKAGTLELAAVEAANLRTVSLLIAAGALRRAESRGCHRRSDAAETAAAPWHTLARWDGRELAFTDEAL